MPMSKLAVPWHGFGLVGTQGFQQKEGNAAQYRVSWL